MVGKGLSGDRGQRMERVLGICWVKASNHHSHCHVRGVCWSLALAAYLLIFDMELGDDGRMV